MPVTYANYFHRFTHTYDELMEDQHVLLYDLMLERTGYSVLDRVRALDPTLRNASCIVFRGRGTDFLETLQRDELYRAALGTTPVQALVGCVDNGAISLFDVPSHSQPGFNLDIAVLREVELKAILYRNGAISGPHDEHHYEIPSGNHAEAFIKVGQALHEPIEVERISDWIFPWLGNGVGLISDNGTLLPLLLSIRGDAHKRFGWNVAIRCIDSYPGDPSTLQHIVNDVLQEVGRQAKVLFLVSVSGSGKLVQTMGKLLFPVEHSLLVICDTACQRDVPSLIHIPVSLWPVDVNGSCEMCQEKKLFYIDPRTYERVLKVERRPVLITPPAASSKVDFWQAAERTNAVHLHHDLIQSDGTLRHYGVYLDIGAMLTDPWFKQTVVDALQGLAVPSTVLVPEHNAADAIRNVVIEAYGNVRVLYLPAGPLHANMKAELTGLTSTDTVLIVDDAFVSGVTLHNVRPLLHAAYKLRDGMPRIQAFVMVARPSRKAALRYIRNRYRDSSGTQFYAAHEIFLPDHRECPWCRERERLLTLRSTIKGAGRDFCAARLQQLSGKLEPPFLLGSTDVDQHTRSVGSLFGTLSQTAAFAAAGSAIYSQWLDATGDEEDGASSTVVHYVDVPRLLNNYFADAFGPAVFRTMKPAALTYVGQNTEIIRALEALRPERAFPCIMPELLWAVVEGKLPAQAGRILLGKISERTPDLDFLSQLVLG